jgi:hypothetical protein
VLLASPDAVASGWVSRELDHWLANKSRDRILVVVTGGTWDWNLESHMLTGTGRVAVDCVGLDAESQIATWQLGAQPTLLWQVFSTADAPNLTWSADGSTLVILAPGTQQALDGQNGHTLFTTSPAM